MRVPRPAVLAHATLLVASSLAPAGCTYGCDLYLSPSFSIQVFDASTGQGAASGATIRVVGRDFADSVTYTSAASENAKRYLIYESDAKPGLYVVSVTKSGYRPWQQLLQLRGDKCHVSPISLDVQLVPL